MERAARFVFLTGRFDVSVCVRVRVRVHVHVRVRVRVRACVRACVIACQCERASPVLCFIRSHIGAPTLCSLEVPFDIV